ncbi:MAG: hypothetical protein PHH04_00105 [Thomasclavelia sp.]|nr:hypothetical protein [Thomasclavelia sp.]
MQIYYFSRTGRSEMVAKELAQKHNVTAKKIDDHIDWSGKAGYIKAGGKALSNKSVPIDYPSLDDDKDIYVVFPLWAGSTPPAINTFIKEIGAGKIVAIVTSKGSTLKNKYGFKEVIDLIGEDAPLPEEL